MLSIDEQEKASFSIIWRLESRGITHFRRFSQQKNAFSQILVRWGGTTKKLIEEYAKASFSIISSFESSGISTNKRFSQSLNEQYPMTRIKLGIFIVLMFREQKTRISKFSWSSYDLPMTKLSP